MLKFSNNLPKSYQLDLVACASDKHDVLVMAGIFQRRQIAAQQ